MVGSDIKAFINDEKLKFNKLNEPKNFCKQFAIFSENAVLLIRSIYITVKTEVKINVPVVDTSQ